MLNITVDAMSLTGLIDWASNTDPLGRALHCNCPSGKELTRIMQQQCNSSVCAASGVYAWISIDHSTNQFIYIGKTGKTPGSKTSQLRWRLFEELRDERAFLWQKLLPIKDIEYVWSQHYKKPAAMPHLHRALRKTGTTHVLWAQTPKELSHSDLIDLERLLILSLEPIANAQRPKPRTFDLVPLCDEIREAWIEKGKRLGGR